MQPLVDIWEFIPYNKAMKSATPPSNSHHVLGAVLRVMVPLARWLVRSGIGYTEFVSALKPLFLEEARSESRRNGGKTSDSALSLLSGLHRKDIRKIALDAQSAGPIAQGPISSKASLPSQVVTRWLARGLESSLPLTGDNSFESLARSVSVDVHPRAIQDELLRLGVATVHDGRIELHRRAFIADPVAQESQLLLADGAADHLAAGVHNLTSGESRQCLEQAVFADGLSEKSVRELEQLATRLWQESLARMVEAAVPMCEHDEPRGGDQRLRLGMYCFTEPVHGQAAVEGKKP